MKVYETPHLRNVALVGHGGCGKTSLVAALLFDMGAVNRMGRVDDGTTVTDFDPDEIERKISLQTGLAYGEWRKAKINLLDTPGYANFLAEARVGPARRGRRGGGRGRGRGRRGADAEGLGVRRGVRAAPHHRGEPHGPRPRVLRAHARVAAERVRTAGRATGHPAGRGEGLRGRRGPGDGQGRRLRRRRERQVPGGGGAARSGGGGAHLARDAGRDGGREQRGPHRDLLRQGHALAGGPGARAAPGRAAGQALPGAGHVLHPQRRSPPAAGRHRGPAAVPRGPGRGRGHQRLQQGGQPPARRRRAAAPRSSSRRSRIRTRAASACSASTRAC